MRFNLFFILIFLLASDPLVQAQDDIERTDDRKFLIQDPRVDSLILLHRKAMTENLAHEEHDGIVGYRIQIFFESGNNSKNRALGAKERFDRRYSHIPSYVIFKEPYYRVRVGDFRTKLEAEAFLHQINRRYSNAFVIQEKIKLPKLIDK